MRPSRRTGADRMDRTRIRGGGLMPTVEDVCTVVRSKNAGPYWVTFDLFFKGPEEFARYAEHPALGADTFARLYRADPAMVKHYPVASLNMVKISYARTSPQGGEI